MGQHMDPSQGQAKRREGCIFLAQSVFGATSGGYANCFHLAGGGHNCSLSCQAKLLGEYTWFRTIV